LFLRSGVVLLIDARACLQLFFVDATGDSAALSAAADALQAVLANSTLAFSPIVVCLSKTDLPGADPERVRRRRLCLPL
jgi:hypothetical protein